MWGKSFWKPQIWSYIGFLMNLKTARTLSDRDKIFHRAQWIWTSETERKSKVENSKEWCAGKTEIPLDRQKNCWNDTKWRKIQKIWQNLSFWWKQKSGQTCHNCNSDDDDDDDNAQHFDLGENLFDGISSVPSLVGNRPNFSLLLPLFQSFCSYSGHCASALFLTCFSFPILCLLPRVFSAYLCIILNIAWFGKKSSLQTTCCFLLVVLAISGYFLYKGRQQRKSGSRFCSASAFVDPWAQQI